MSHTPDVYTVSGIYDASLPPYRFPTSDGRLVNDEDLLRDKLVNLHGKPTRSLDILELGAGSGRMTEIIAPYALSLTASDKYDGMLSVLQQKLPEANTLRVNTRDLASVISPEHQFDYVGAYWTLSYPIGEYLESISGDEIIPVEDLDAGVHQASTMIGDLVDYLKPGGALNAYFFDSESPEQRVVTQIWEQLAPDPGGRRSFTREIATTALASAAEIRGYTFTIEHHTGIAPFKNREQLIAWYALCHAKGIVSLTETPLFTELTNNLADQYEKRDGSIELPVGMYEFTVKAPATKS